MVDGTGDTGIHGRHPKPDLTWTPQIEIVDDTEF